MTQTLSQIADKQDPPNATFPPFRRGRTGIKGRTKYIQIESGSWITFNEDGSCHVGARHQYLGNLLELAGDYQQRKEYAEAWRINMQRAERDSATLSARVKALEDGLKEMTDHYAKAMKDAGVTHYPEALAIVRNARQLLAQQ